MAERLLLLVLGGSLLIACGDGGANVPPLPTSESRPVANPQAPLQTNTEDPVPPSERPVVNAERPRGNDQDPVPPSEGNLTLTPAPGQGGNAGGGGRGPGR